MIKQNLWISFLPVWIIVNGLGCLAFGMINAIPWFPFLPVIGASIVLGLFQWIALQKPLGVDWTWILTSIVANIGLFLVSWTQWSSLLWFITELFGSLALLGIFQWLVLKDFLYHANRWIYLSPFAALIAKILAVILINLISSSQSLLSFLFWMSYGLVYGVISGAVLIVLINLPKPKELEERWSL